MVEEGIDLEDVECGLERSIQYLSMYLAIHCGLNVSVSCKFTGWDSNPQRWWY